MLKHFCVGLVAMAVLQVQAQRPVLTECAGDLPRAELDRRIEDLIGQMTPAERIAQLQDRAPAIPRLGIPAYNWWNEGLHGIARNGYATVFPQAIGLAATWDPGLLEQIGDVVSTEARAKFDPHQNSDSARYAGLTIWSPNINIFRDPRWGRGQETYGEDPYLTGLMGSQFVQGIQGREKGDSSSAFYRKADATPKHFAVHSGPESLRDGFNAKVSQHDLAETYTPAFRAIAGIEGAQSDSLMCSYNAINGVPACANPLLHDRLREEWGFQGYVVSDCDAVDEITEYLHFTPNLEQGAAAALKAGVDLDCGDTYSHLQESLDQGLVGLDDVNRALHRLLLARLRLGMLQPASCSLWSTIAADQVDTPADRKLAMRAAEESMVLLRNEKNLLPMKLARRKVAVIGPTADLLQVIEANYHGTARNPRTLLEGLREGLGPRSNIDYAQGAMLAEGVAVPVPRSALRTGKDSAAAEGLTGEYFSNTDLRGQPVRTRIDARIDFDLDRVTPAEELGTDYSVRWSGFLSPPGPGKYTLRVNVDRCFDCKGHDGYRLWVDGKVALDDDGNGKDGRPDSIRFDWPDAHAHALRLELRHSGEDEGIHLEWEAPAEAQLAEALTAAKRADVVLAIVGLSPDLEGEALRIKVPGFNGGDRETLTLPEPQRRLLAELGKLGKPMIVVVTSGSAVALGEEAREAQAEFEAWYPGEEGGHALARLLTGAANPSGRLPVTVYRSVADLPAFTDYSMAHRTYRYYDGPVQYPFGFGLSYSRFEYATPKISTASLKAGETLEVTSAVRNAGQREGDAVAELYLVPPRDAGAPRIALQGVQRLHLLAGARGEVRFMLTPRQLSLVDAEGKRAVRAGRYRIYVGGAQPAELTSGGAEFEITGEEAMQP